MCTYTPWGALWSAAVLIVGLAVFSSPAQAAGAVFWVADPVRPGEAAMVIGEGFANAKSVRITRLPDGDPGQPGQNRSLAASGIDVPMLQPGPQSLKFVLPATQKAGVFQCNVTGTGAECVFTLNQPQPIWLQGDAGVTATPGGYLRAFGRCLYIPKQKAMIYLQGPRGDKRLLASEATEWAIKAAIPQSLPEGEYKAYIHNGCGGPAAWSAPLPVTIKREKPWPQTIYNVKAFGADSTGVEDSTGAVQDALGKAQAAGGGVIYFPRGRYRVTKTLELPRYTVLKGETRALSAIFWPDSEVPLPQLIKATNSVGVEDLTFYASNCGHFFVSDQATPDAGDVHIRRILYRGNMYRGHITPEQIDARMNASLKLSTGGGDSLRVGGHNVEVVDCDIYGSGRCLSISRGQGANIARNKLYNGRWGWYCIAGSNGVVFEDNQIIGGDLMSTGGGLNCLDGSTCSQNVYYAHNIVCNMHGWDREAMTSDAGGGAYYGKAASGDAISITLAKDPTGNRERWIGAGVFILNGKGRGQYRRIKSFEDRRIEVDEPWIVAPDSTSSVTVTMLQRNYLFIGNSFSDAGIAIQLYGMSIGHIAAENRCQRAGGYHNHGMDYGGVQPSWYIQWLDNEILEGNEYSGGASGKSHIGVYALPPSNSFPDPLTIGCVVRRNWLHNNSSIEVGGAISPNPSLTTSIVQDVIVEHNRVENSDVGVQVRRAAAGILVRENDCQTCKIPIQNEEEILRAWEAKRAALISSREAIAHWSFDGVKGATVQDLSGHGFSARAEGDVTFNQPGVKDEAATFDGKSALHVGQGPLLNLTNFTLSAWIKPEVLDGRYGILAKRERYEGTPFVFCISNGGLSFEATDETDGSWSWNFNSPQCLKTGVWQHVACVVEADKGVTLYCNGKQVATKEHKGRVGSNMSDLIIGKEVWGGRQPNADQPGFYSGAMDEVKIWARALTPEGIAAEANN